ncbi:MAG: hypothetical protein R3E54_15340 [Halioglobus sp.]
MNTTTTGTRVTTQRYFAEDKGRVSELEADDTKVTQFDWDLMDRIDKVIHPDLEETDTDHDANGNVKKVTVPSTYDYDFEYTEVNELHTFTTPLNETTTYIYDRDRRLQEVQFPSMGTDPNFKVVNTYAEGLLDYSDTKEGRITLINVMKKRE